METNNRLHQFEKMLADIVEQANYEQIQLDILKSQGKEKTATYRQYFGKRLMYKFILDKYKTYGLID